MIGKSESFSNVSRLRPRDSVRPLGPSHVTSMSDPSGIGNSHPGRFSCSAGFLTPNCVLAPNRLRLGTPARSTVGFVRENGGIPRQRSAGDRFLRESSCGSSHGPHQFRRGSSGTLSITNSLAHHRGAHPASAVVQHVSRTQQTEVECFRVIDPRQAEIERAEGEPPPRGSAELPKFSESIEVERRAESQVHGPVFLAEPARRGAALPLQGRSNGRG